MEPEQQDTSIDFTLPRKCFYLTFAEQPGPCPSCGKSLHQSLRFYLVATRQGNRITDTLAMSGDMGWFCASCPTVVINVNQVSERLQFPLRSWDVGGEFTVMGLVDLDAISPEQAHLPLGEIDPLPLVPFEAVPDSKKPSPPRRPAKKKRPKRTKPTAKRRRKKKRRR
jgi:hypothetical protein